MSHSVADIAELRRFVEDFVAREPDGIWGVPLLAAAPADQRFDILARIGVEGHLFPKDLLPSARSVVAFFVPINRQIARENGKGGRPTRSWAVAYVRTNDVINRLSQALGRWFEERGLHFGLTPATHNFSEDRLMAQWSHRHIAHLVNLGRFGFNHMLITPVGCVGRLGSLVTDADLGEHPIIHTDDACLVKAGKRCSACVDACPVQALTVNGFDRRRCWERLKENRNTLAEFADLPPRTHVCGKCVVNLPCSFCNPMES